MTKPFLGQGTGKCLVRLAGGLVVAGAMAFSMATVAAAQGVDVRIYDSHHKDYHNWDDHEDRAYRRYLAEKHYQYVEYQRQQHRRQEAYWKWRHHHPDY
jgi:3-hydroxyacyl-CoA dehydrogenase